jgi:hypothetical protein
MCEINDLLIGVAVASIVAAIAAVITAAVLNNGFFSAPAAPAFMIVAGASSGAAVVMLSLLLRNINDYYECMGSPAACAGELAGVTAAISALIAVLSIQAAACFAAAGIAWIPWAGAAPMYAILASLIVQLGVIPTLYVYLGDLVTCANEEASQPAVGGILVTAIAVALVAVVLTATVQRRKGVRWRWEPPK